MRLLASLLLLASTSAAGAQQPPLAPHTLSLSPAKSITLSLPRTFSINVALTGLHCPRFFATAPDGRLFVADLYDRSDNTKGSLVILDGWNAQTRTFARATPYLSNLRNPNNLAFYTDPATHQSWLYTAFTDRLVRYRYRPGDTHPTSAPEVLAHYPDYGLNYKYGGWHLTRTVAFATLHGRTRLYVTVGSSCNACREKEPIRATLSVMDPDGSHQQILAAGLRNAVDLAFVPSIDAGALFATNMGADHLGDRSPEDTFLELDANARPLLGRDTTPVDFGWPTCYILSGTAHPDPSVSEPVAGKQLPGVTGPPPPQADCSRVPAPWATFPAHSSPLGLEFFPASDDRTLANSFLVALHGPSRSRIGSGYRVVRLDSTTRRPQPFVLGFLSTQGSKTVVTGRPCGLLRIAPDAFLLTDDLNGVIYAIYPATTPGSSGEQEHGS